MNKIKSKKRELSYIHCFGFLTLQMNTIYVHMYIVGTYRNYLHFLCDRSEKLARG